MTARRKLRSFAQSTVSLFKKKKKHTEHKIKLKHKYATELLYFPKHQQLWRTESRRTALCGKVTLSSTAHRTVLMRVRKISKRDFEMSPSVHPSVWNTSVPTERIFIKFDMSIFRKSVEKFQDALKSDKRGGGGGTLHEDYNRYREFKSFTGCQKKKLYIW